MVEVIFVVYLVLLSVFDGRECKIPIWLIAAGFLMAVIKLAGNCLQTSGHMGWLLLTMFLGMLPGILMVFVAFMTQKMGYGDGLILMCVGMIIGYKKSVLLVCFSLFLMSVFCIGLLCCKKGNRHTKIPYLPFFTAAYLVGVIAG